MRKSLIVMIIILMTFSVYAGDFYMLSNKSDKIIPAWDSYNEENVNFELQAGQIFELINSEEEKSLILNSEGLAGWINLNNLRENSDFILIEDSRLKDYFSDDKIPARSELSIDYNDYSDSPMKITVSLKGLTVHAVCELEDFDRVYPVGVGVKGKNGKSITPTNVSKSKEFFLTWPDKRNSWYWMKKRTQPAYFGGFPFIRTTIENDNRAHTYGFHGPITKDDNEKWVLHRGYVSHGCMRMRGEDVTELFNVSVKYPGSRIYIIEDYEYRPDGSVVDCDYPRIDGK